MDLRECYAALGGDYDEVMNRLPSEKLVRKFVLKFLADGSYDLLCRSFAEGNYEEAFRASHTIKGVCQNLSFTKLYESSHALTETLRGGQKGEGADELYARVREDYAETVQAIQAYEADSGVN